jgi:hypothetical protein
MEDFRRKLLLTKEWGKGAVKFSIYNIRLMCHH